MAGAARTTRKRGRGAPEAPPGWRLVSAAGPGPFVTSAEYEVPGGGRVRWHSRSRRKAQPAARRPAQPEPVWWRPRRRQWWMAVLFCAGSACFAAGALVAQWAASTHPAVGVVFFAGSIFFTSAAYLQYAEAVNSERLPPGAEARPRRWRPASWEPRRIDWLATLVQLIGTVFFNVSTFAAMKHGLTTRQVNARVWAPDAFGSVAFLVSSELAFAEVCHRWLCLRRRALEWWIVALNLTGSLAFGLSAIASLLEPSSGEPLSAHLANSGTALGGLCFLAGALLLMPEAAAEEQRQRAQAPLARRPGEMAQGVG